MIESRGKRLLGSGEPFEFCQATAGQHKPVGNFLILV